MNLSTEPAQLGYPWTASVEHWFVQNRAVQRRVTGKDIGQVPSRRAVSSRMRPTLTMAQVARCSVWSGCPTAASLVTTHSGRSRSIDCDCWWHPLATRLHANDGCDEEYAQEQG